MKGKRLKNAIAVSAMLFGLVSPLLAGCEPGTAPPACCPKITDATKVSDPWVCPAHCPGGGKTRVTFRVEFWKGNELCPPPSEVKISIKNLTDRVDLPPLTYKNPGTGVYEGTEDIRVTKDTDFELTVTGGDRQCGTASGKLRVDVVDECVECKEHRCDYKEICGSGPLFWPPCEHKIYEPFGPGVLVECVENPNSLKVRVAKDVKSDSIAPYQPGYGLQGLEASGTWTIGLTSENDCSIYDTWPQKTLCVKVYLQCKCR